jgi:ketosteroid isomerase-like protein
VTATAPETETVLTLIRRFEASLNRHDVDALMAAIIDDCAFEIVAPAEQGALLFDSGSTALAKPPRRRPSSPTSSS